MDRRDGHPLRRALTPFVLGLCLAALSNPDLAGLVAPEGGRRLPLHRLGELALEHLVLAALGFGLVGTLGVGLGILATRPVARGWRGAIDAAAALAQGVPPVVVVALALPVLGFGGPPTLLALACYAVMPTLRSTVGALESISSEARGAAVALGLAPGQVLVRVELPLAAPGIVEALRTALVLSIATVAIGALAGASTLGTPIVAGLQNQNIVAMLQGAAATAAMAFLGDSAMLAAAGCFSARAVPRDRARPRRRALRNPLRRDAR